MSEVTPITAASKNTLPVLPGAKILLVGGSGTGKTYSLRTLIDAGLKVAVVFTDPGMEAVIDVPCEKGFHWRYTPPFAPDWTQLLTNAENINKLSNKALQELSDPNRSKYREWFDFISAMSNFKCERCGLQVGPLDKLNYEWAVVNDGLSGISIMSRHLAVGGKAIMSQPDWGVAMDNIEKYMMLFTGGIKSFGVMISHLERETDEITGGITLMASTLGRKLAPKLPRMFSDVVQARREGTKFVWSTATFNVDLKARNLPIADNMQPTFVPLVEEWRRKQGVK